VSNRGKPPSQAR